jgi:hypothetical protein
MERKMINKKALASRAGRHSGARASKNKGESDMKILSPFPIKYKLKILTTYKRLLVQGFCFRLLSFSFVSNQFRQFPEMRSL